MVRSIQRRREECIGSVFEREDASGGWGSVPRGAIFARFSRWLALYTPGGRNYNHGGWFVERVRYATDRFLCPHPFSQSPTHLSGRNVGPFPFDLESKSAGHMPNS